MINSGREWDWMDDYCPKSNAKKYGQDSYNIIYFIVQCCIWSGVQPFL